MFIHRPEWTRVTAYHSCEFSADELHQSVWVLDTTLSPPSCRWGRRAFTIVSSDGCAAILWPAWKGPNALSTIPRPERDESHILPDALRDACKRQLGCSRYHQLV